MNNLMDVPLNQICQILPNNDYNISSDDDTLANMNLYTLCASIEKQPVDPVVSDPSSDPVSNMRPEYFASLPLNQLVLALGTKPKSVDPNKPVSEMTLSEIYGLFAQNN
jgi:hypothetical protein